MADHMSSEHLIGCVGMRRHGHGLPRIDWTLPVYPTLHHMLTNPVYAGAYAFGRRGTRTVIKDVRDSELAALDMSIRRAQRDGAELDVKALVSLRDRLLAIMPSSHARRADADAAAMLEAQGYACRPGPRTKMILGTIAVGSFAINIGRGRVKVYINATSTVECGLNTGFVAQYGRMSPNAGSVTLRNQRLAG
jgi:hypothetical protein